MKKLKHTFMTLLALGISFGVQSWDFIKTDAEIQQLEEKANQNRTDGCEEKWTLARHYLAKEDYTKALYWLEKRGGQYPCGESKSDRRHVTAELYHMGLGVPQDLDKAISLYEKHENMEDYSYHINSKLIRAEKNGMKIPEDLKNRAEQGDVEMMILLAEWYSRYDKNNFPVMLLILSGKHSGKKEDKDKERMEEYYDWMEKAAKAGNAYAQYEYAVHSYRLNEAESFRLVKKSAEQGYRPAQATLASLYARGEGTIKDVELALKYARLACENGADYSCRYYNYLSTKFSRTH